MVQKEVGQEMVGQEMVEAKPKQLTFSGLAEVRPAEDLAELARQINSEHEAAEGALRDGLTHGHKAGEKLLQAKEECLRQGKPWHEWLEKNCPQLPLRTAQHYMRVARVPMRKLAHDPLEESLKQLVDSDEDETNWVDKECRAVEWYTPPDVLERVREFFGGAIPLDPATAATNPTEALRFFTAEDDGLAQDWSGQGAFVNPPYGTVIRDWCRKIDEETARGLIVIALLPCGARFSTEYWQDHVLNDRLTALCFIRGRLAFITPEGEEVAGNPYDSVIYGFNADLQKFCNVFGVLGKCFPRRGDDQGGAGRARTADVKQKTPTAPPVVRPAWYPKRP
jgi:site-specific DNA-methyltransferase (adenine-specific)